MKNKPLNKKCYNNHYLYYSNDQSILYILTNNEKECDDCDATIYSNISIHCRRCEFELCNNCYKLR